MDESPTFGEQLYSRLQDKGLSKYQIDKVVALQRLDSEVAELGQKGLLADPQLLEISKVTSAARQKQLAELAVEKSLPAGWVKELVKLVRNAEKARHDQEANRYWDFFFEVKEMIEREGPTRDILQLIKNFSVDRPAGSAPVQVFESDDRRVVNFNKLSLEPGRGLDVGTVNICAAATRTDNKDVVYNIQRNAFLDVRGDAFTKKMLMKLGIDYIQQGDKGYVLGDAAFELANVFEKNTRRPMKDGMISPTEPEALLIVSLVIAQCIGHPRVPGEVCAFSVPADPIDVERNVIYHRGALETILRKLGYTPRPMLEGHSIVFSELKQQDYTGIGISCGGGMFNVCVAYKSVPALTFATSRGGDWIDNNVAAAIGLPASQVCALKESGVDLSNPKDRIQDAIVIYYRNLIQYTLETMRTKLENAQNMPTFTKPIDVVCGGGTSMIGGFIDVFREEFEKVNFPIEVANIRMANDPLKAVARGCMTAAMEETKALREDNIVVSNAALARSEVSSSNKATDRRIAPSYRSPAVMERSAPSRVEASSRPPEPKREAVAVQRVEPTKLPKTPPKPPPQTRPAPPKPAPKIEEISELEEVTDLEEIEEIKPDKGGDDLPLIS
ncbi:MAG TPA: hypothetical protein VF950_11300 [Planctomycetota bacterium]